MPKGKVRVLIVDDSASVRQILQTILNEDPDIEVMGTASDPFVAARRLQDELPDVMILDLRMPDLGGVAEHRCAMRFGEPDRRAEVIDVSVREQERVDVVDVIPELTYRSEHVVALAREACVDDQQTGVVGDERPIHQVGLREVDGVGDLRQLD